MQTEYLILILACYAIPGLYIFIHRRFLTREYRLYGLNPTVFIAAIPFILWDVIAVRIGHWLFNPQVTLPGKWAGLPFEEFLFFLLIPQSCLLVWVALKRYSSGHSVREDILQHFKRKI